VRTGVAELLLYANLIDCTGGDVEVEQDRVARNELVKLIDGMTLEKMDEIQRKLGVAKHVSCPIDCLIEQAVEHLTGGELLRVDYKPCERTRFSIGTSTLPCSMHEWLRRMVG